MSDAPQQLTICERVVAESLGRVLALARSLSGLDHPGVKGLLREGLIESFFEPLLVPSYRAGTGVIIDSKGVQSGQCDVVIWDDSIFRPIIMTRGAGLFPVESVVAVIEIKSVVDREAVRQALQMGKDLKLMSFMRPSTPEHPNDFWGAAEPNLLPLNILFGFSSDISGCEGERARSVAAEPEFGVNLSDSLQILAVAGKPSWAFQPNGDRTFSPTAPDRHYELLMPIAGVFNSLRDVSAKRGNPRLGTYLVR
jgi:hypothetical protein